MIYYKNDLLLKRKNIYSCLVKPKKDLRDKNFALRTPNVTLINKNRLINLIIKKYWTLDKGFLCFIKELEVYLGIKYASIYKTKYKYLQVFKKNKLNIVLLRVISLCLLDDKRENIKLFNRFIIKDNYITIGKLKLKIKNFGKNISYLVGVISGDGHLNKRGGEIIIADGQTNKIKLEFSKQYLQFIYDLFNKEFNICGTLYNRQTYWGLRLSSKWLSRFINSYFEVPFGNKSGIIKFPRILSRNNEKYFWRGIMDTDGYIREKRKMISLKSKSLVLINQLKDFCEKNKINIIINKERRVFSLTILSGSILKYAKFIGFCHPRKKDVLINYLLEGPKYRIFKEVSKKLKNKNTEIFKYLRPYKNEVYIKINKYNKKGNRKEINKILSLIKKNFNVKIIKIKRNRFNDHHYICSKGFSNFIKKNVKYDLPWQPLNNSEIYELTKRWEL